MQSARAEGVPVIYGDATHPIVLEATTVDAARLLVITTPDIITTRAIISHAKRQNAAIKVVAQTSDPAFVDVFRDMGVSSVILPEFEASLEMVRESLLYFPFPLTEIQNRTESLRQHLFAPFFNEGEGYRTIAQLRSANGRRTALGTDPFRKLVRGQLPRRARCAQSHRSHCGRRPPQ